MQMERMTEIINNLWVGDKEDAKDLEELKGCDIEVIINVTMKVPNYFPKDFIYHNLYIDDCTEDISKMNKELPKIVDIIDGYLRKNKGVFVHCSAGSQRSCSVIAGYLVRFKGMTYDSAIDLVCNKRDIAFLCGYAVNFEESIRLLDD